MQEHLSGDEYEKSHPSRKEKSLGLLCHKFLARYPDYPSTAENNYICLDEVAEELSKLLYTLNIPSYRRANNLPFLLCKILNAWCVLSNLLNLALNFSFLERFL